MQRRKFLVGLGSLAAGGAAAMGTGALSQTNADRDLVGRVANDANAYLQLTSRTPYAINDGRGQLVLDFSQNAAGGGLNADSENWFDGVFAIGIGNSNANEEMEVWIEENGPNSGRFEFYADAGKALGTLDQSTPRTLQPGNAFGVGVYIDLQGTGLQAGDSLSHLFTPNDTFTIHADDTS